MRRHESLIPLSKQHHQALILAQLLKKDAPQYKGLPVDSAGKREYLLRKFKEHLVPHFDAEENILIPFLLGRNKRIDELSEEIIAEHKLIVDYVERIGRKEDLIENMNKLGHLISKHVRKEEREYFQLVQEVLPEKDLNKLTSILLVIDKINKNC